MAHSRKDRQDKHSQSNLLIGIGPGCPCEVAQIVAKAITGRVVADIPR